MLLSKLKNNPSNPRTLSEVDFKKLLNKILVYPRLLEKNKITFDSEQDNTILGGNMRFKTLSHIIKEFANKDISKAIKQAQKALGVDNKELLNDSIDIFSDVIDSKAVPDNWLQDAKGLTSEEKQAFIIIDNVSDGKWDFDVLANEWELDTLDEWNIEVPIQKEKAEKDDDSFLFSNELDFESNYVVLKFTTDIDWIQIKTLLELDSTYSKRQNGKPWSKGIGRVVDGVEAIEKIKKSIHES